MLRLLIKPGYAMAFHCRFNTIGTLYKLRHLRHIC